MKKIVDVIALERELENRLDVLNADTVLKRAGNLCELLFWQLERVRA